MNDTFDIRRLGAFMLKWYKERTVFSVVLVWVLFFILLHMRCFFGLFGLYAENEKVLHSLITMETYVHSRIFMGSLFLLITVLTLKISVKLFSVKTKSYWLLPISKFEKLTFVVVNSLILPIIVYILLYCAVNMANDYKYVYWNTTEISVEEIEKEYGDVVVYKDNLGVEYYKVYPKIKSYGLFIWRPSSVVNINENEASVSMMNKLYFDEEIGIVGTFWMIFFVFSLALWMGVSQYNNSTTLAHVSHIVLLLVWIVSVVYVCMHLSKLVGGVGFDELHSLLHSSNTFYLFTRAHLLLPIAYLWVAWKKMGTMQIKNNEVSIVKKYDLLLLALYGVIFAILFVGGYLNNMEW